MKFRWVYVWILWLLMLAPAAAVTFYFAVEGYFQMVTSQRLLDEFKAGVGPIMARPGAEKSMLPEFHGRMSGMYERGRNEGVIRLALFGSGTVALAFSPLWLWLYRRRKSSMPSRAR